MKIISLVLYLLLSILGYPGYSWTVIQPTMSYYDIDYDYSGNIYAYGRNPNGTCYTFYLNKYTSIGNPIWQFSTPYLVPYCMYGDFAVNRSTQEVYLGSNATSIMYKLDQNKNIIASNSFTNPQEIWRISYNNCTNQLVFGGAINFWSQYSLVYLDQNLNVIQLGDATQSVAPNHDVVLLELGNSNDLYVLHSKTTNWTTSFDNEIMRVQLPLMNSIQFQNATGYSFDERYSISYGGLSADGWKANHGFNGIALDPSSDYLYTYDGQYINQYNKTNGLLLNKSGRLQNKAFLSGGIHVDNSGNILVGVQNTVQKYSSALTLISTVSTEHSTVYDLKLGPDILYVCGNEFISSHVYPYIDPCFPVNLPVELTEFTAEQINDEVLIKWKTSSELNNDYFIVLSSDGESSFKPVLKAFSKGNTSIGHKYSEYDKYPGINSNEGYKYYKLVQVDTNGKKTVFGPISTPFRQEEEYIFWWRYYNYIGQQLFK